MTIAFPTIERPAEARAPGGELWALFGNRLGDNRMIEAAAGASGLDWRGLPLRFNPLGALPNLVPHGSLFTLTPEAKSLLGPPWPAVTLTSGKRAVPVALWIKAASGGKTKLVHLGRPQAPLSWFDLVITTPQYGLPDRPNVMTCRLPATAPQPALLALPDDLAALPQPRLAAVIGGPAAPQALDAATARAFAAEAMRRTRADGGSLLVVTSPRTPQRVTDALRAALDAADVPIRLFIFGEGENRYPDVLAAADGFLVTDDSVSMAIETAATGRPVALFRLPERPGVGLRLLKAACSLPATRRAMETLVALGLVRSNRDIAGYMHGLEAELLRCGDSIRDLAAAELAEVAHRVRRLANP